ncbi:hypothetical protein JM658_12010 [Joostella atrarenae]|uniref:Uncharacterized protein n=1 Tax=Joostella atrarenae TaxID=679257 RepID=A0ABS9J564_9FLAO|nr:hypothetical protein [Joostella atrarenae]MCF8715550.1 hypothetical protein [Joostella atrarenae]
MAAQSYSNKEQCDKILKDYIQSMEETWKLSNPDKASYMKYSIETSYNPNLKIAASRSQTEVAKKSDRFYIKSEDMLISGDKEMVLVVIPKDHRIYWNSADPKIFESGNNYLRLLEVQRKILESAKEVRCTSMENKVEISIIPSEEMTKTTNLIKQEVVYDFIKKAVIKVSNQYNQKSQILTQEVTYNEVDLDSSIKVNSPREIVFSNDKLREKYKGFQIIDNR